MKFSELAQKKVAGVPILYLAAAAVLALAIYAWRMKPTVDVATEEVTPEDEAVTLPAETDPYAGYATNGTVTVVQQPAQETEKEPVVKTNEDWVREGAEWAVTTAAQNKGIVTSGSAASTALTKYIAGEDTNYEQTLIIDAVIVEKGQPPESVGSGGVMNRDAPAKRQGTPPTTHTVKGNNDNNYSKLIALYYGDSSQQTYDLIQSANLPKLGLSGNYPVGTQVIIPKFAPPRFFKATKTVYTSAAIAARNGISTAQLAALNNSSQHTWAVGKNVRVG